MIIDTAKVFIIRFELTMCVFVVKLKKDCFFSHRLSSIYTKSEKKDCKTFGSSNNFAIFAVPIEVILMQDSKNKVL